MENTFQFLQMQNAHLSRGWNVDETVDVNIDKCSHQELAVKPIHDSSMSIVQG